MVVSVVQGVIDMEPTALLLIAVVYIAAAIVVMGILNSDDVDTLSPLWAALWPLTLVFFILFAIVSVLHKLGEWIGRWFN